MTKPFVSEKLLDEKEYTSSVSGECLTPNITGYEEYFQLPEGYPDETGYCKQCEEFGACRDWVAYMSDDTSVELNWLALMVLAGEIDNATSCAEVETKWAEIQMKIQK